MGRNVSEGHSSALPQAMIGYSRRQQRDPGSFLCLFNETDSARLLAFLETPFVERHTHLRVMLHDADVILQSVLAVKKIDAPTLPMLRMRTPSTLTASTSLAFSFA